MSAENVIFITGTGRSGTNILKSILGRHSKVASLPFEHRFTVDPHGILDFYNTFPACWSPYYADEKIKELERFLLSLAEQSEEKAARAAEAKAVDPVGLERTPPPYAGWELNQWIPGYSSSVHQLIESLVAFKYRALWPGAKEGVQRHEMYFTKALSKEELTAPLSDFLKSCFDAICQKQQRQHFVEDNTHHLLFASDLKKLVPGAKLIHVVRDPRDVIASLLQQRWAPSDASEALTWLAEILDKWGEQKSQLHSSDFVEIKMEDLVKSPKEVLSKITDLAQLDFEDAMLDVELSSHNTGRYQSELTPEGIQQIERRLSDHMSTFGYTPSRS